MQYNEERKAIVTTGTLDFVDIIRKSLRPNWAELTLWQKIKNVKM